jgi:hypothetical protein
VRAAPFAHLQTDSEVMLIWFRHDSPAAPLKERNGELTTGNRTIQPLPAPPRPAPPSAGAPQKPSAKAGKPAAAPKASPHPPAARAATARTRPPT